MTDQLLMVSAPSATSSSSIVISPAAPAATQDYFTYLSVHSPTTNSNNNQLQHHFINIQTSSPPLLIPQFNTPEITVPEIRLAPPQNNEDMDTMHRQRTSNTSNGWHSPTTGPEFLTGGGRSRGHSHASSHTLAPRPSPSLLSVENDDAASFYSARQSLLFDISPSTSFDHHHQLSAFVHHQQYDHHDVAVPASPSITTDMPYLNISSFNYHHNSSTEDSSSLLYPAPGKSFHQHSRENSNYYSFYSRYFYPSMNNLNAAAAAPSTIGFNSKWCFIVGEISQVMLPTLQGWKTKSFFSKLSAMAAAPLVLIFTLTLPVAEIEQVKVDDIEVVENDLEEQDEQEVIVVAAATNEDVDHTKHYLAVPPTTAVSENDLVIVSARAGSRVVVDDVDTRQGWNKYLLMVQSIISTLFIFSVLAGK